MSAPAVLRDVFHAYRDRAEEDDGYLFTDDEAPINRLDVLVYRPTSTVDMTSFATIGMAAQQMPARPRPGGGARAELRLRRRGSLSRPEEHAIAVQLANLAIHPFLAGSQLSWGHMIGFGGDFPTFPGCPSVLLAGPLSDDDPDCVQTGDGPVRLINVVPITDAERDRGRELPPADFARSLRESVDIFAERPDPITRS
ncbi:suppressor of fused domain protein [Nucisporomicrobium flavum]|jgi:Suppressor of fused protein (SUFU)|uniref:suppressor of fused domain protein n=1 Tax=Nucisporomicrobium flavum TaxID=2785915 RepID=UPI0018F70DFD|nr:suppressor of fused domain protein [Nucisporomicrobium flavum]